MGLTFNEVGIASRPDAEAPAGDPGATQLILQPGESGVLLTLQAEDRQKRIAIKEMGVTQHPNTKYQYVIDGVQRTLPAPLGTLINPLRPCAHWGFDLEFFDFQIIITNTEAPSVPAKAHGYVGYVVFKEPR